MCLFRLKLLFNCITQKTYEIWNHMCHKILYKGKPWIEALQCKLHFLPIVDNFHNGLHIPEYEEN